MHKYRSSVICPTCFIRGGTQNTNSKEHCMCIKEKQNISSQSFVRNLSHFYTPFRYLWYRVLAPKTSKWEFRKAVEEFQPMKKWFLELTTVRTIRISTCEGKSTANYARKWCQKLCAFLFAATCAFGKMWLVKHNPSISYFCKIPEEGEIPKREKIAQFFIASF